MPARVCKDTCKDIGEVSAKGRIGYANTRDIKTHEKGGAGSGQGALLTDSTVKNAISRLSSDKETKELRLLVLDFSHIQGCRLDSKGSKGSSALMLLLPPCRNPRPAPAPVG